MTEVIRHRLSERDEQTLTAKCSVCGFVAIRKAGNGYQCAVKKAESHKAWAQRNPAKARVNRTHRSGHQLHNRDYVRLTAFCSSCALTVDLVIYGAGYACGVRARELRSTQQAVTVGSRCRECSIIDGPARAPRLRADGSCPRCEDQRLSDLGGLLRDQEYNYDHAARDRVPDGTHLSYEDDDPYAMPEYESAVPGWRTLGSERRWDEV